MKRYLLPKSGESGTYQITFLSREETSNPFPISPMYGSPTYYMLANVGFLLFIVRSTTQGAAHCFSTRVSDAYCSGIILAEKESIEAKC